MLLRLALLSTLLPYASAAAGEAPHYANEDPADDAVVAPPAPRPSCTQELETAGVRFKATALKVHTEGKKRKLTCGAPDVVTYLGGPEKISYSSAPLVTCAMALALARYETVVQEEAMRTFGARVKRIGHLGTYNCRQMAAFDMVSEHAYANGIDVATLTLVDGRTVSVLKDFQATDAPPTTKKATFLRAITQRGYDEGIFSNVITEYFDKLHQNHFHLDLARYRVDGSRHAAD